MTERPPRKATKVEFGKTNPQIVDPGGKARSWVTRGGNFSIVVSEVQPGAVLDRANDPEEHMVISPPNGFSSQITSSVSSIG